MKFQVYRDNISKLHDAILTAHAGKYSTLDVRHRGSYAKWNSLDDIEWQKYINARKLLYKYSLLEKLLKWMKVI